MLTDELRQMSFAALCVAILVAVAFYAATAGQSSQRPPPSLMVGVQQKQAHSGPTNEQAANNPSDGDDALFTVKVIPGAQSADRRAEAAKDHDEKSFNESWLTRGTIIIAVFTVGLALIAGVQAWFFWRQLGIMKDGLIDAKAAADASTIAANAASESARAGIRQAEVAEASLAKLERPYVYTFNVSYFLRDEESQEFYITYSVGNFGKSPAIITGAWVGFEFSDRAEPSRPTLLDEQHILLRSPVLAAGEIRTTIRAYLPRGMASKDSGVIVAPVEETGESAVIWNPRLTLPPNNQLFFIAAIDYDSPFVHDLGTSALWLNSEGTFVQRPNETHTYSR
jgi:hypothetical protein